MGAGTGGSGDLGGALSLGRLARLAFLAPLALALAGCSAGGGTAAVAEPAPDAAGEAIDGFTPEGSRAQRELERRFLAVPDADSALAWAAWLSGRPRVAGSPELKQLADSLADRLRAMGFEVRTERFDVLLPHPRSLGLSLRAPEVRELSVREPCDEAPGGPPPADGAPDWCLGWHAYAASGRAEAEVVYANFGTAEDFRSLERAGVEVDGRIVLARHGAVYRGVKVHQAEQHGAAGLVLYSDPAQDGFAAGDTLPLGPYRPSRSIQRGTVSYLWIHPGDPLTPGRPAVPDEPRLAPDRAANLPSIPVLSIGYGAAEPILRELQGPRAPEAFRGGLPLDYRLGPGPARLRMEVANDDRERPIFNVIARLPGREPGEVILGNHFDAWLYGGVDPYSGTSAMLEIARGLAVLSAEGWRPRRDLVLAFWDAEEFAAVGSTEWVEAHVASLQERAVAYLNVDVFLGGILDVAGSPSLRDVVHGAARAVPDPVTGESLAEMWHRRQAEAERRARSHASGNAGSTGDAGRAVRRPGEELPRLGDLGAGSDWTAFLHFAGVPSLQWTMNNRGSYAVWHSVLDDLDYLREHADPGLAHSPAMAGVMGVTALRLAEAEALPFRYTRYADRIGRHLDGLEAALERDGPAPEGLAAAGVPAALDDARVRLAVFREAAERLEAGRAAALRAPEGSEAAAGREGAARRAAELAEANRRLPAVERAFLDPAGLPGRPWYRHQIVTVDAEDGYGPLPLPVAAEALRRGDPGGVAHGLAGVAAALARATRVLESAAERMERAARGPAGDTPQR